MGLDQDQTQSEGRRNLSSGPQTSEPAPLTLSDIPKVAILPAVGNINSVLCCGNIPWISWKESN